jgi:hypothetical protein
MTVLTESSVPAPFYRAMNSLAAQSSTSAGHRKAAVAGWLTWMKDLRSRISRDNEALSRYFL